MAAVTAAVIAARRRQRGGAAEEFCGVIMVCLQEPVWAGSEGSSSISPRSGAG